MCVPHKYRKNQFGCKDAMFKKKPYFIDIAHHDSGHPYSPTHKPHYLHTVTHGYIRFTARFPPIIIYIGRYKTIFSENNFNVILDVCYAYIVAYIHIV